LYAHYGRKKEKNLNKSIKSTLFKFIKKKFIFTNFYKILKILTQKNETLTQ
jgi:hypothetical protein